MKNIVFTIVLVIMALSLLDAVPYTTMGLLRSPDAYVLPNKAAEISFTNYLRREESNFGDNKPYEYVPMGMVNVGILNRLEVGGWLGDGLGFANFKVKLVEETPSVPQVAIGIDNVFSPINEDAIKYFSQPAHMDAKFNDNPDAAYYEKNSPYVVFSKASIIKGLPKIDVLELIISMGIGSNKFRGQIPIAKRFEGLFGSIYVQPVKNFTFIIENDGFNMNLGAQYFYKNFTFKASYVGVEEQENNRIGLGVTYLFDKYADPRQRPILFMDETGTAGGKGATSETVLTPTGAVSNSNNDLLEELKRLREQREQAQKVLDELKNQLKEMESETESGQ